MVRAVFFDFGNSLVSTRLDWARIMPRNLAGLTQALRERLPGVDYRRLGADLLFLRQAGLRRAAETLTEVPALESLRAALALQGVSGLSNDDLQAGVDGFFSAEENSYPIIFGVPEMLAALREMGLPLAVISNATCGKLIRRALVARNLAGFFQAILVSADLGVRKPHPEIFHLAAKAVECRAEECVMVGDDVVADIGGAQRAGLRAVLANFIGREGGGNDVAGADAVADQPRQVVEVIGRWRELD